MKTLTRQQCASQIANAICTESETEGTEDIYSMLLYGMRGFLNYTNEELSAEYKNRFNKDVAIID